MRKLINFQLNDNGKIITIAATIAAFFMSTSVYAQQTLTNANKALKSLQDDLIAHIIPVAAAVILLCLAIGYAGRYIEFVR